MKNSSLTAESVGQHAQGGFDLKGVVATGAQGRAGGTFESADEALDVPAASVILRCEVLGRHGAAVVAAEGAVLSVLDRLDNAFDAPTVATELVDPLRIVAGVGVEPAGHGVAEGLTQQRGGLGLVVARPPIQVQGQGQEAAAEDDQRELDPLAPLFPAPGVEVGAGRGRFHSGGVNRDLRSLHPASRGPADGADHLFDDGQHLAAGAEFLQRGVVRQFIFHPQSAAQRVAGGKDFEQAPVGGLEISAQNQAGHELALGEILAAGHRTVVTEMALAQGHGQSSHAFQSRLLFSHALDQPAN